jgi:glycosyltransferase involved in cell wall biosynthesis
LGKPRCRILLRGLKAAGAEVLECHKAVWQDVDDKSRITSTAARISSLVRWIAAYPGLVIRYLGMPAHDLVFIGYLGILDVVVLWPWARLRRVPIVWDVFISTYDTVVEDRGMASPSSAAARALFAIERLACRLANLVFVENAEHARCLREWFQLPEAKVRSLFTGSEPEVFPPRRKGTAAESGPATVVFFGMLIPLHGIQTFLDAAALTRGEPIQWTILGRGQQQDLVKSVVDAGLCPNLAWVHWVPYPELYKWIHRADVCVGILGRSEKASRVIPNKVFQVVSCGVPLITRDSPAVRELLNPEMEGVMLIPAADPEALASAVREMLKDRARWRNGPLHRAVSERITPEWIGRELQRELAAYVATLSR